MKKDIPFLTGTKANILRNASWFGMTIVLSSTVFISNAPMKAFADEDTNHKLSGERSLTKAAVQLLSLDTSNQENFKNQPFELQLKLDVLEDITQEVVIKLSPNVQFKEEQQAADLKNELGQSIGHYTFDSQLNQIKLNLKTQESSKVTLPVLVTLKTQELKTQIVSASLEQQIVSKTIVLQTEEASTESSAEVTQESTSAPSTSTTETTTSSTSAPSTSTTETTTSSTSAPSTSTTETTTSSISAPSTNSTTQNKPKPVPKPAPKPVPKPAPKRQASPVKATVPTPTPRATLPKTGIPQDDFVLTIAPYAQGVAHRNNLYASVMIAQAILESGYGQSSLASAPNHNLFGIKGSYHGQSVTMQTWEHFNGRDVFINAQFRKYPSFAESFQDNANVLKTTSFSPGVYFYSGAWKSNTNSYQDATAWLRGRYATDPNYNYKLNSLIVKHNLTQYDTAPTGNTAAPEVGTGNNNSSEKPNKPTPSSGNYQVKSGDTLFAISRSYGLTVSELKRLNGLTSDLIYVGQTLKVTSNQTTQPKPPTSKPGSRPTPTPTNEQVVVKAGDTLYGLSQRYGMTVFELKQWNHLESDLIYVGQTLKIKGTSGSSNSTNRPTEKPTPTSGYYVVKSGDTLYGISRKYNMSVSQLKSLNQLSDDLIYINQRLKVSQTASNSTNQTANKPTPTAGSTYKVKSGDTLYRIALQNHLTVSEIKSLNQLTSDLIYVGQTLKLKEPVRNESQREVQFGNGTTHRVKAGESLWALSRKYGISVATIKEKNKLSSDIIYVGQTLKIN